MTDKREELIEAAKRAISDYDIAKARHVSVAPDRLAILLAEFVAVFEQAHTPTCTCRKALGSHAINCPSFEQAHTPTDDEREAYAIQDAVDWWADYEAEPRIARNAFRRGFDAAAGFRRTVQGEPPLRSAWHATPAVTSRRTVQGEPTDAHPKETP